MANQYRDNSIESIEERRFRSLMAQRQQLAATANLKTSGSQIQEEKKELKKMLVLAIIADAAEFLTGGTLGWIVGLIIDLILLYRAGVTKKAKKQLARVAASAGLEKIPGLNIFPVRTFIIGWSYIKVSSPRLAAAASKATKVIHFADRVGPSRNSELATKYRLDQETSSDLYQKAA